MAQEFQTADQVALPVQITVHALPAINYALEQNGILAIKSVTIENNTDQPIENAELTITAAPEFAAPFSRHIDFLPPHKAVTLHQPKLTLKGEYLAGLTEKVNGQLQLALSAQEQTLCQESVDIAVLAFDQWHGLSIYPELLAAFVTPNHPEVARIIARATEFLGNWTGDTSMDGYQSQDPNRVLSQAAAIFAAIKEQAIAYCVAAASFEEMGQRVRLCDKVLQLKLGNCLELTLLYASCLEAVGLHPLLVHTPGHVFTGLWLEDLMFPETVQDDASLLTKRMAAGVNEIALAETTFATSGQDVSFDDARAQGEKNIATKPLEYIIDIHRARLSGVAPLPQRIATDNGWEIRHDTTFQPENLTAPTQLDETVHIDPNAEDENPPKKAQWERKLLDLGMRNTLINLRMTKSLVPILTDSLDNLENALADGSDFSILPKPLDWSSAEATFENLRELGEQPIIQAEFANKRLRATMTELDLGKTIKNLYRNAKAALEENGANTLYLALGMLRWYENKRSTKPRYAPIILIPIEMVRKSALQGYVIRLRDDEPQMNITLLEKLKQDFGIVVKGLDPLPGDEHGIDIRKVLTVMRKAVMEQKHWDVLEAACIGIFSFSQFVMWNDIRNRTDDLMRNKVVRSLMEGKLCWDAEPLELGDRVREEDVLLPMPADASQLYAIRAAVNGESFVLHGPPGTGKSQTITSLIANALANGKRVLFVAEKMAALEVVQKRLESIGIGAFCLELHSNKSKKKAVLEQLRKASEVTKTQTAEEYALKAQQLAQLRKELDVYATGLHTRLACGSDLYTLINEYELYKTAPELPMFARSFLESLTKNHLDQQQLTLECLFTAAKQIGHPHGHPLGPITCTQYTQTLRTDLQTTGQAYLEQLRCISEHVNQLLTPLGQSVPTDFEELQQLAQLATYMTEWHQFPAGWAKAEFPQQYFDEVILLAQHSIRANNLERELLAVFHPQFLTMDGTALYAEYVQVNDQWFLPRHFGMQRLTRTLRLHTEAPLNPDNVRAYVAMLRDYQAESQAAGALLERYGRDLGSFYRGKDTGWEQLMTLAQTAASSAHAIFQLQGSYDVIRDHCGSPVLKDAVVGLSQDFAAFTQAKNAFCSLLGIHSHSCEDFLGQQLDMTRRILNNAEALKEWLAYVSAAQDTRKLGLGTVVAALEAGALPEDAYAAYKKALLMGLISVAIDDSGTLNQFSGALFNQKIDQYKRLDRQWTQLSQQEAYCRLAAKVPNFTREAASSSELGILQRCIKSGARGVSIRSLFDQIPNLLPRLCPCMLMSPISAAQYLDPQLAPFDIVVFDEASQLPTCKAVGVLARGENAVIVGDPKQMPPTAFFATNAVDEDNLDIEDLESILDDCLALNMPQSHLLWHYRSRHESLIAFSNSQFYENKLFTFPSVNDRESKVRLVPVDGYFDRGKTRTNKREAAAVIEEIRRRAADPVLQKQSLGVVTFNISQQHLIDDLLTEACAQDPELEKWVNNEAEPLFIKNLENVQGDERDVILFSIGFGPDKTGKITMNFGPLNRDGGWRRLNVAVSRARCEMVVFSTLRSEQLDLNRTQAEGVAALRSFLAYAEGRALALEETALNTRQTPDGIAQSIGKALQAAGYETDLSVGRSEYRIDVAIIDPQKPDQYMLGILLDGEGYGSAKTTRDREIAQEGVLTGLGWQLLRIWTMDWWDNAEKEMERIFQKLRDIEAGKPEEPEAPTPAATETKAPLLSVPRQAPVYQATQLPEKLLTAEEFVDHRRIPTITRAVEQVIAQEAPISLSLLTKRIIQSYGITRSGTRIQAFMNEIYGRLSLKTTHQEDATFCWQADQYPGAYIGFRVNGEDIHRRDVKEVPVQEVANAIYVVLYEQLSMCREDLMKEAATKLGFSRLGGNVLSAMELGLRYAESQNGIDTSPNGNLTLTGSGTVRAEETLHSFKQV